MANYLKAFEKLIGVEGGFAKIAGDVGGRTIYGIAENFWPEYWKNGPPTLDVAKLFYRKEFWNKLRLDEVNSEAIANEIFDSCVNIGFTTPVKWLQISLNILILAKSGIRPKELDISDLIHIKKLKMPKTEFGLLLSVDGDLGSNTLYHLNSYTKDSLGEKALFSSIDSLQAVKYLFESKPNVVKGHLAQRTRLTN